MINQIALRRFIKMLSEADNFFRVILSAKDRQEIRFEAQHDYLLLYALSLIDRVKRLNDEQL